MQFLKQWNLCKLDKMNSWTHRNIIYLNVIPLKKININLLHWSYTCAACNLTGNPINLVMSRPRHGPLHISHPAIKLTAFQKLQTKCTAYLSHSYVQMVPYFVHCTGHTVHGPLWYCTYLYMCLHFDQGWTTNFKILCQCTNWVHCVV